MSQKENITMERVTASAAGSISDTVLLPVQNTTEDNFVKWRNLISYWLLGLCNNYGYVVMLSAAHDILSTDFSGNASHTTVSSEAFRNSSRACNPISTGAILLADILPCLFIKIISPFFTFSIHFRVLVGILMASAGFLLVALASSEWMAILGVVFTSMSSGLGEVSFLSYSAFFDKNVVSTWSSGTGGAGIFGAISYAGLTSLGLSASTTLLSMLVVPILMGISFWLILKHPNDEPKTDYNSPEEFSDEEPNLPSQPSKLKMLDKLKFVPPLLKFMIPLFFVYYFEYFINQGLFELVQFPITWLSYSEQYRWYQVVYQIGVFISRSSVNIVPIKQIWFMGVLQLVNLVIFLLQVMYSFIPSIWVIFALVLWEGLLGGAAYVNAFYRISVEIPKERREFSMGITSLADATGIGLAGFTSIPAHNALCLMPQLV